MIPTEKKKSRVFRCYGGDLLWMDDILHHLETMGNHCLLAFTRESSLQGFLGGAGFRTSTVFFGPRAT